MKKYLLVLVFLTSFLFSNLSWSRPIISGISTNEIDIDTNFNGTEILLFGAKGDAGNIVIAVRGPKKNYFLDKKGKFLGIWYNKKRLKFKEAYSYYAFYSTLPNFQNSSKLFSDLELGKDNIDFHISGEKDEKEKINFQIEFIDKLIDKNLYLINPNPVEFLDETLFKVMLKFPKNIASGIYTVEIYLIDENNLTTFQTIPIKVNQVGFSADIHNMAYENQFFYGIIAVLIAVTAGWLANYIFSRFFGK